MRVPSTSRLAVTHALLNPATALPALRALAGSTDAITIDGLLDLLPLAEQARQAVIALEMLTELDHPAINRALARQLRSRWPAVQTAAVAGLQKRKALDDPWCQAELIRLLSEHNSWTLRREVLRALADSRDSRILIAASDPHWRVRYAFAQRCLATTPAESRETIAALQAMPNPRVQGVVRYLQQQLPATQAPEMAQAMLATPQPRPPIWDDDPAVLARLLRDAARQSDPGDWPWLPQLLEHDDESVWRCACQLLLQAGTATQLAAASSALQEPRHSAYPAVVELFARIDRFRHAEVVALLGQEPAAEANEIAEPCPSEFDPQFRAAAMTPEQAVVLWENPERETSWQVLAAAGQMLRRPLWEIAPDPPWEPPFQVPAVTQTFSLSPPLEPAQPRLLGPARLPVSALALSGHYHLPPEGFAIAVNRGVNLFFWESNYDTLTSFSRSLATRERQQLHFIAGTFEATPQAVRKDAERALRVLHLERLDLFLLFWTRSWQRLDDELRRELDDLQQRGIVGMVGLSTHNRELAREAIEQAWNPVMVRHSAAHRGAESSVFPAALALGTSLLAFNSTCYGRLLKTTPELQISAADCYRYTLSQAAVTSCLCAPATLPQLHENLQVLENPSITAEAQEKLLRAGAAVYEGDRLFRQTMR